MQSCVPCIFVIFFNLSRNGGIGRRARFRSVWEQSLVSSSLISCITRLLSKVKRVIIRLVALARKRLVIALFDSCEAGTSTHEAKSVRILRMQWRLLKVTVVQNRCEAGTSTHEAKSVRILRMQWRLLKVTVIQNSCEAGTSTHEAKSVRILRMQWRPLKVTVVQNRCEAGTSTHEAKSARILRMQWRPLKVNYFFIKLLDLVVTTGFLIILMIVNGIRKGAYIE